MNELKATQLVVIGAGPGGYTAAFLAADLGLEVTLIDREALPGGVCLHRGCIPSKTLLHAAKILSESKEAKSFGIEFKEPAINIDKLRDYKDGVAAKLSHGLKQLIRQRKITFIEGEASFINSTSLKIKKSEGQEEILGFQHAILASGSSAVILPGINMDSKNILDSTKALELEVIPKILLIVGGSYIGLEIGTIYAALGSKVTIVEMLDGLLPNTDRDLVNILTKRLEETFENILLKTKVVGLKETSGGVRVSFEGEKIKDKEEEFEKVLVAIGRRPNTDHLGLENTKIKVDERGFIKVNSKRQSDDPHIYAIGDITGEPMLAHKASAEGRVAAQAIAGHNVHFEPKSIPAVVYTDPEIATCGLSETQAAKENRSIKIAKFPWAASGRAMTINRTDGLTKLILDPSTGKILGASMVGTGAGELISEAVLAIEMNATASDLKHSVHAHPTLSETIMESAEAFFNQSTHLYSHKKDQ